jgi:hypothetical protein
VAATPIIAYPSSIIRKLLNKSARELDTAAVTELEGQGVPKSVAGETPKTLIIIHGDDSTTGESESGLPAGDSDIPRTRDLPSTATRDANVLSILVLANERWKRCRKKDLIGFVPVYHMVLDMKGSYPLSSKYNKYLAVEATIPI